MIITEVERCGRQELYCPALPILPVERIDKCENIHIHLLFLAQRTFGAGRNIVLNTLEGTLFFRATEQI